MTPRILILDDDRQLSDMLSQTLELEGFTGKTAAEPAMAWEMLKKESFDLLILDFNLPGMNGVEFLRKLRDNPKLSALPVLMLTVKGDEAHKIKGLTTGADDYMVKPASMLELVARVKALIRRAGQAGITDGIFQSPPFQIDINAHEAKLKGAALDLTPAEFDILAVLVQRRGMVLSYQALAENLSRHKDITSQTLYVHANNLRKKLGKHGHLIETIHGVGYKLNNTL